MLKISLVGGLVTMALIIFVSTISYMTQTHGLLSTIGVSFAGILVGASAFTLVNHFMDNTDDDDE